MKFIKRMLRRRDIQRRRIIAKREAKRRAETADSFPLIKRKKKPKIKNPKPKFKNLEDPNPLALGIKTKDLFNKNKGGRPRLKDGEHSKIISFSVSESLFDAFRLDIKQLKISGSVFFRELYGYWKANQK